MGSGGGRRGIVVGDRRLISLFSSDGEECDCQLFEHHSLFIIICGS